MKKAVTPSSVCRYSKSWGCSEPAVHEGCCRPHAVLQAWLIYGEGDSLDRIMEHDSIARLPAAELEVTLRGAIWDPRIRKLLRVDPT